ncbi:MAG: hypothetical protein ABI830_07880, partial [Pseudolabrys sp.]
MPSEAEVPIRSTVDRVLAAVAEAAGAEQKKYLTRWPAIAPYSPTETSSPANAELVIVSSLAEGADRIVADSGRTAGFALEAVLPFSRIEYANDFATPESKAAFEGHLTHSIAVFELDGKPDMRPRAYEKAGAVMLANIDLLITIWNGGEADGIGGTAHMVSQAIADGIPVVWINPAEPDLLQISLSRRGGVPPTHANTHIRDFFHRADAATVGKCMTEMLQPPVRAETEHPLKWLPNIKPPLDIFLAEHERRWNFCLWYPLLLRAFAGRKFRWSDIHLPPAFDESRATWQKHYFNVLPRDDAQQPVIEAILLPAFTIADRLAVFYALVYRSAYVFNFLFAAIASAIAVIDILFHGDSFLVLAELIVIVLILATWGFGTMRQWHRRWLEYRRLAECLRHMRILAPVGSGGSTSHQGIDANDQDWVTWYASSVRRLLPLPNRVVDEAYVAAVRDAVRSAEIAEQCEYHTSNIQRMSRLNKNIETVGALLFALTLVTCLILYVYPPEGVITRLIAGLTALLPTAGAALGAIHVQGDFKTAAEQSRRTEKQLATIDEYLKNEPLDFGRVTDRIEHASRVMMADLRDWQTV